MMGRAWTIGALCLLTLLLLCACGAQEDSGEPVDTPPASEEAQAPKPLDTAVIQGREGELDFAFSLEDWITAYNLQYREDRGEDFLQPLEGEGWSSLTFPTAPHSQQATVSYEFLADVRMFNLPTMTVYVPQDGACVQEITVNFDDHDYAPALYEFYQEMCFYTVKTLRPEMEAEQIRAVCQALDDVAYGELRLNKQRYGSEVVPVLLYHKDGIGFYSHFALGDYVRLCVIPVTEETLADYAQQGTQLRELP